MGNHFSFENSGPDTISDRRSQPGTIWQHDVVLPVLFERLPDMTLADSDAVVWSGVGFRGPLNLPVLLKRVGCFLALCFFKSSSCSCKVGNGLDNLLQWPFALTGCLDTD